MTFRIALTALALSAALAACASTGPARAQEAVAAPESGLTLTIQGISTPTGTMTIGVFDEAGYDSGAAITGSKPAVTGDTLTLTFANLAPGEYAIKLFHDVNGNGKMDTNPFGAPTEPYAFSNNAKGRFGPAKWDAARFTVDADGTVHIIDMH